MADITFVGSEIYIISTPYLPSAGEIQRFALTQRRMKKMMN